MKLPLQNVNNLWARRASWGRGKKATVSGGRGGWEELHYLLLEVMSRVKTSNQIADAWLQEWRLVGSSKAQPKAHQWSVPQWIPPWFVIQKTQVHEAKLSFIRRNLLNVKCSKRSKNRQWLTHRSYKRNVVQKVRTGPNLTEPNIHHNSLTSQHREFSLEGMVMSKL